MTILSKIKEIIFNQGELIKTGIEIAEANIGKGKNTEKKEFVIKLVLSAIHIPSELKVGLYDFNVASQINKVADEAVQIVFDKLKETD